MLAAFVASACQALVNVYDDVMMDGCYEHRRAQPLFVSCSLGPLLGLLLTLPVACLYAYILGLQNPITTISTTGALLGFLGGASMALALLCYFTCFSADKHDAAEIAAYIAATPVAVLGIHALLADQGILGTDVELTRQQEGAILIAGLGLVVFATIGEELRLGFRYHGYLLVLLLANAASTILVDQAVIVQTERSCADTAQHCSEGYSWAGVLTFFWFGLALGCLDVLRPGEWRALLRNRRTIELNYGTVVVLVEALGMLVFFFETMALAYSHPAIVATIIGSHILLVSGFQWFVRIRARTYGPAETRRILPAMWVATERISTIFPPQRRPTWHIIAAVLVIASVYLLTTEREIPLQIARLW